MAGKKKRGRRGIEITMLPRFYSSLFAWHGSRKEREGGRAGSREEKKRKEKGAGHDGPFLFSEKLWRKNEEGTGRFEEKGEKRKSRRTILQSP